MRLILAVTIFTNLLFATSNTDINTQIALCAKEKNDTKRLNCFDKLSKQEIDNQSIAKKEKMKSTSVSKKVLNKNERIEKLINTNSNIEKVYFNIYSQIKKDKFESSKEYKERLDNPKFNTYAVMERKGDKEYDADKKLFKVCFDGPSSIGASKLYYRGDSLDPFVLGTPKYVEISFKTSSKESTVPMSNSFGRTVNVSKSESTYFAIHPNNFRSIMKKGNIRTTTKKDFDFIKNTCVNLPADKDEARQLDSQNYIIKMGVNFINIRTMLYQDVSGSEATISSPSSYTHRTWGFDGHINEFVIYNKDTKEVLFQYTD